MSATRSTNTWKDRPEEARDAVARVRAFQQAAVEHCNAKKVAAADIVSAPGNVLPLLAREHGLLVTPVASEEALPLPIAVFVVGASLFMPPVGLLTVTLSDEAADVAGALSFFVADSLVPVTTDDDR